MPDDTTADLALVGGSVLTIDPIGGRAAALAVRGGRIVAVGGNDEVREHIGPTTRVIELEGRTVLPGFQDAHVHPIGAGLEALRCSLHDRRGLDAYLAAVVEYAARRPDTEWITGGGWSMDDFPGGTPRAEDLDRVIPDRPAFLPNRDGHGAWVNTLALDRFPAPHEAVLLAETVEALFRQADDPDEREILELSLQGFSAPEIAAKLGRAERSVRRVRERVRKRLERMRVAD